MNLFESLAVAFEGLAANKARSTLTMLGVIIGVGAVIAMLGIARGAEEQSMQFIQRMGTNVLMLMGGQARTGGVRMGFGSFQTLTLEDAAAIAQKCPSVLQTAPEARSNQQVKYGNQNSNVQVLGVTPDYPDVRNYSIQAGRFLSASDVKGLKKVAVIGQTTATNLFGDASPIGKSLRVKGIAFQVIGLLSVKGAMGFNDQDDVLMIPITTSMRRVRQSKYVSMISVQAKSMEVSDQAITEVSELLRKRHRLPADGSADDFNLRNQADFIQMAQQSNQTFTFLLAGIACVSLLVGGIGIMNIMLVSVTERTREIGIRMALGAKRRDILFQFLIESLVLSLLGGILGIALGIAVSAIMGMATGWTIAVSPLAILLSFLFAAAVGIFFGIYPARRASLLDPIDALRYE